MLPGHLHVDRHRRCLGAGLSWSQVRLRAPRQIQSALISQSLPGEGRPQSSCPAGYSGALSGSGAAAGRHRQPTARPGGAPTTGADPAGQPPGKY